MYWEAGKKKKKKMKRNLMKWSFVRRTERKKMHIAHAASFRKRLIKGFLSCQESKHRNANKIPQNALPFISAGFLWVLLYSIDTAKDHRAKGLEQWLSRLKTRGRRCDMTIVYYKTNKHNWLPQPFTPTWPSLHTILFKVKAPSTIPYLELLINVTC